jgi:hypothetical protein
MDNRVIHHANGTGTIGDAMNILKRAVIKAENQARANGNKELVEALDKAFLKIYEGDMDALNAICDLQD